MSNGRDSLLAALDAYTTAQSDAAVTAASIILQATIAAQGAAIANDATIIAASNALVAAQKAQLATADALLAVLRAKLAEYEQGDAHVLYGANIAGWFSRGGEPVTAATTARIKAGFGGRLPAIRIWPNGTFSGTIAASAIEPDCQCYMIELDFADRGGAADGKADSAIDAALLRAPRNAVLVVTHEPENAKCSPSVYQRLTARVGARHIASGRTDVKVVPMLMGTTFMPNRYPSSHAGNVFWDQWIANPLPPGIDGIGGDLYPWGKDDASADSAATVIQPAINAATKMGVPFYVGEFGCGKFTWSDRQRAKFTAEAFALFDANAAMFPVVLLFETDAGAQGPWCILPKPGAQPAFPLTVDVVRKAFAAVPAKVA